MDEFGILHGEDAKRLHDYLNSPNPVDTEAGRELMKEAVKLAKEDKENRKKTERDFQDDDCVWMTSEEEEKRIRADERERVLDKIEPIIEWGMKNCYLADKPICPFEKKLRAEIESLRGEKQ
jgi:hypothetical protein